jgi:hypothetical protein
VPKVARGTKLHAAEQALVRAHCKVGPITQVHTATVRRHGKVIERKVGAGLVVGLTERAGKHLKAHTAVGIEISRG